MNKTINDSIIHKKETKFYTKTFEKASKDRRERILDVAMSEFAANGYNGTNINTITKKAEISIGSMYSYFPSKEDLFLTIVDMGYKLLEEAIAEIDIEKEDIFTAFERLLYISRDCAIKYPELNQIYLDSTTQGLSSLSGKLSRKMESLTAEFYLKIIRNAKAKGLVENSLNEQLIALCLDNLIVMFQFSFTSDYYKERMKIFLGDELSEDYESIIQGVMRFVKKALKE